MEKFTVVICAALEDTKYIITKEQIKSIVGMIPSKAAEYIKQNCKKTRAFNIDFEFLLMTNTLIVLVI
jgi:hypothetical protein